MLACNEKVLFLHIVLFLKAQVLELQIPVKNFADGLEKILLLQLIGTTHVLGKTPYFTPDDVARAVNFSERAVITLLGSPYYIWGILRTKNFEPTSSNPVEKFNRDFDLYQEISTVYNSSERPPNLQGLANYLEKKGFSLYVWFDSNQSSVATAAEKGAFTKSLDLQLIKLSEIVLENTIVQQLSVHIKNVFLGKESE